MKDKISGLLILSLFMFWLDISAAWAHVTPNVKLSTMRETVARLLPTGKLFLKDVRLSTEQMEKLNADGYWPTHTNHYKFYVSRNENDQLQRAMVSITEMSRHGPMVVAVAFSPDGTITDALVTDVMMEPLTWVGPLLRGNYMEVFKGKNSGLELVLDSKWASATKMTQTYALIIAHAVKKAALLFDDTFKVKTTGDRRSAVSGH